MVEPTRPARVPRDPVRAATRATYAAFAVCGFGPITYMARLPQVRAHLHLSTGQLGVILLAAAAGALCSRPFAHRIILRLGLRGTVIAGALVAGAGQVVLGVADLTGVPLLVTGFMLAGFSMAIWDVAMNVEGTIVEQRLGRTIMPRFHAGYSVGTVAGALTATVMVLIGVPVVVHMVLTGMLTAIVVPLSVRGFLPGSAGRDAPTAAPASPQTAGRPHGSLEFWREPRTLLIGLFVLAFSVGEGAGNDWIGVGVVSGYRASAVVGTAAYATFLAATTATRWFGARILDRHGRATVLRTFCVVAAAGLLLFCSGFTLVAAFIGVALWGVGIAFGYPVGMSAAADDPRYATERVTVVSTIGKVASFLGPPLLGLLGDHVTILHALIAAAVLQLVAAGIATVTQPLEAHAPAATAAPAAPGLVAVSEKA